jgi:Uma2 family endonuclease
MATATLDRATTLPIPAARFVFDGVCWNDYQAMLRIVGNRPIRVTYDRGRMEIVSPLWEHGSAPYVLGRMVDALTEELVVPVEGADPVTFNREDVDQGAEPNRCYYLGDHAALVRGKKRLEMGLDPPPDLVIEADITSTSMDRLETFGALGVPEVWRYSDETVQFLQREADGTYRAEATSLAFPHLSAEEATQFVETWQVKDKTAWIKGFRAWVRDEYMSRSQRAANP